MFAIISLNLVSGHIERDYDFWDINYDSKYAKEECKTEIASSLSCVKTATSQIASSFDNIKSLIEDLDPSKQTMDKTKVKELVKNAITMNCQLFKSDECKDFISEDSIAKIINSSKCHNDEYEIALLGKLAAIKGGYLAVCGTDKSDNMCPIGEFISSGVVDIYFDKYEYMQRVSEGPGDSVYRKNSTTILEQYLAFGEDIVNLVSILKDFQNVLTETCKDSECNKKILEIDSTINAAKIVYEKEQKISFQAKYPKLMAIYNSYMNNYREEECSNTNFLFSGSNPVKKITYTLIAITAISILLII